MIDKEYLREQTKNPTGHYTEILIRTYYFILKQCEEKNQDWCYSKEISYKSLKKFSYAYIGYDASLMVIKNALKDLAKTGHINVTEDGFDKIINILKPLDFLDEDIVQYVSKPHPITK